MTGACRCNGPSMYLASGLELTAYRPYLTKEFSITMVQPNPNSNQSASDQGATVPNPLCDIGRTHPRDRHRMRPVEGQEQVWICSRHELYALVVAPETATSLDRGDAYALPDGAPGVVIRQGDERGGGVIIYVRAE